MDIDQYMDINQYVYSTRKSIDDDVDFLIGTGPYSIHRIFYTRKSRNLQSWMAKLYYRKGGKAKSFNCVNVKLTKEDLWSLLNYASDKNPEKTEVLVNGVIWGIFDIIELCRVALDNIENGYNVYYTSWW